MTNYQKLMAMYQQLDIMYGEVILMDTLKDPSARRYREDAMTLLSNLIIQIACMAEYEKQ